MGRYRKKPVVIEAVQFDGIETVDETPTAMFEGSFNPPDWIWEAMALHEREVGSITTVPPHALEILTLEGTHRACPGDWIIQGIKGELYPCKPDIFAATYEAAE